MKQLIYDLAVFIFTVLTYWQASAPATFITGVVGVVEKVRDKSLSKRVYLAVFLGAYLFFGVFLAWREQLNEKRQLSAHLEDVQRAADQAQKDLDELKKSVDELRTAKADQTIVQVTAIMLALETVQPFREGQPIFVNVAYANTGAYRVHNFHFDSQLQFVAGDKKFDAVFQNVYARIESFNKEGNEGQVLDPANQQPIIASLYVVPTAEEVQAFYAKQKVLALAIRIEYNDTLWYERCAYLNPLNLHGKSELWNVCTSHNKAGQHPLGRLF